MVRSLFRPPALLGLVAALAAVGGLAARFSFGRSSVLPHGQPAREEPVGPEGFRAAIAPVLNARCVRCHGPDKHKAGLRLDAIDPDLAGGKDIERWRTVYGRINRGEMPPKGEPPLSIEEIDRVTDWILDGMRRADRAAGGGGGRVALRRMNRAEYANTLRDLLHVELPFGGGPLDLLPPDGTSGGFDKIGSALTLDPSLLDRYLTVARHVADAAIVTGHRPDTRRRRFSFAETARSPAIGYECQEPHISCRPTDLVLMDRNVRTWDFLHLDPTREETIPSDGEYTIRLRMSADLGRRGQPLKVQLQWPGETVLKEWMLGADAAAPRIYEVTLPIKVAGQTRDGPQVRLANGTPFSFVVDEAAELRGQADEAAAAGDAARAEKLRAQAEEKAAAPRTRPNPEVSDLATVPKVILDWIELEGPIVPEWPPRSHRELFFEGAAGRPTPAYARRIFERLLPRAYRRPVTAEDVDPIMALVERELARGVPFEEAVKVGLEAVLTAPQFLFLAEPNPGAPRPLDDYELGARLSYFLWSSTPDAELVGLATSGRLHAPDVLAGQTRRMLADPKAQALVDGFGAEWLHAAKFAGIPPNRTIYRAWDDDLEAAVKREPLAFFQEILRKDLSALNFLDSDFAMLNEPLAKLYGIRGVAGPDLRRVALPAGSHRGGLVTQAGILTIGSDGTRTLPVRRAAWVLDTLFDAPPAPPPPNAGEVEPNTGGNRLSVRERLIQHQQIPACAACHAKIDGYGFGLESFDAVGAWRERQNGEDFGDDNLHAPRIDASGTLPDGRSYRDSDELRGLLKSEAPRFSRALTAKMLRYALGRATEPEDAATIDRISAAFKDGGYRLSALVAAIVASPTFQTN
jgi:mono/diheme cytochrome c family protein